MINETQQQESQPKVYAVTVNWNRAEDTLECITSLYRSTYENLSILVVDNGSTDGSRELISLNYPQVEQIHNSENLGFARGYNIGMQKAVSSGAIFVFIINNDATVDPETISSLVKHAQPQVGMLAPLINYSDDPEVIWSSGGNINSWNLEKVDPLFEKIDHNNWEEQLHRDFVTGCAVLFPVQTLSLVGYFDENFHMYYEDMDLSFRVRKAGLQILVIPAAKVRHKIARSSGGVDSPNERYWMGRSSVRYFRKHAHSKNKPVIILWRTLSALRTALRLLTSNRIPALKAYWTGLRDGLRENI